MIFRLTLYAKELPVSFLQGRSDGGEERNKVFFIDLSFPVDSPSGFGMTSHVSISTIAMRCGCYPFAHPVEDEGEFQCLHEEHELQTEGTPPQRPIQF